ncbi:fasciclin domain-containing protein [Carboxylicivirga sediminis]|uniref:Fasciclin domain-containing protein n=1 Tax=Carboxylicivirga sediminis TaxID=2006564 RepID=A0A941IY89_9BACT|nr:fasciclin domain-containing protein [Carboxylicivirga sediminis]MBR8537631.1 fasciclin domain-containing protein [Carboxylicivirga sediminis]
MKRVIDNFGKNIWVLILMLGLAFANVSCEDDDDSGNDDPMPENPMTITDIAASNADFSILVAALQKVGLDDDLASENNEFTVFAPTNDAFTALLTELNVAGLDDIPNDVLTSVLLYHVVSGSKMANMIETGYYSSLSDGPKDGYGLSFYVDMSSATINGRAKITATDIKADNGIIHVIDKVMLPMTITDHAVANPAFSSLVAGVTKAELAGALDDESAMYTVFAPTNVAFEMFFTDLGVTLDDLSKETLSSVILYHAMGGVIPASMVEAGYFPTLSTAFDNAISLKVDTEGGVFLNSDSEVIATDVVATNGIIHAINKVIMPPSVVDIAIDNSNFSTLVQAVVKAELVDALSGDGPFTVFAPTNAAFDALFTELNITGIDDLTKEDLTPILLAHVVSGNVKSTDLSNGTVPTLNDQKTLAVAVDGGVTIDEVVNVVAADIQGKNGIVHVIDKVIIP